MTPSRPNTAPHDYRVVCQCTPSLTVVGGQAVNLWAINYLPKVPPDTLVSKDLDVVVSSDGLATLRRIPGWVFQARGTKNWTDSRLGSLCSTSSDGRPLLVEVLHSVHGLDQSDLARAAYVKIDEIVYRALDPVTMLKAKAANVRDLKQDENPPRHDREHLQLLAKCVPHYLREVHSQAVENPPTEKAALAVVSHAFKTLQNAKTASTLRAEGIVPATLIPDEWSQSVLPRIRLAYRWQYPQLAKTAFGRSLSSLETKSSMDPPSPTPRQGPKMSL